MKRTKKVFLIILLLLAITALILGIRFRGYIKALYYGLKYDSETIAGFIDENDQIYEELENQLENVTIRDLTDEEKTALEKGELSEDEVVDRIVVSDEKKEDVTQQTDKPPVESTEKEESKPPVSEEKDFDALIAAQIAKMYVLKSQYINYLKSIEQSVIDDYNALPQEQKNPSGRRSVIMSYYNKGLSLEAECDAKVDIVLGDLEKILKEAGRDKSLIATIRTAYENEKTLQKSYYLSIYNS